MALDLPPWWIGQTERPFPLTQGAPPPRCVLAPPAHEHGEVCDVREKTATPLELHLLSRPLDQMHGWFGAPKGFMREQTPSSDGLRRVALEEVSGEGTLRTLATLSSISLAYSRHLKS